jgi:hypothetical protein
MENPIVKANAEREINEMKLKVNLLELSSFLAFWLNYGTRRKIHKFAKVSNLSIQTRPNPLEIPYGQKDVHAPQAYQGWGTRKSLLMALSVNDLLNAPHCVLVFLLLDPCVYLVLPA